MTLQEFLAAVGSPTGSLITPCSTGANWTCSVGLLSSLALMVLSASSEGAGPIWAGGPWKLVPLCGVLAVVFGEGWMYVQYM